MMRASTHARGVEVLGQLAATLDFERILRPKHVRILLLVLKRSTTKLTIGALAERIPDHRDGGHERRIEAQRSHARRARCLQFR